MQAGGGPFVPPPASPAAQTPVHTATVSRHSLARWEIAAPYSRVKMPYRRSAHLRVKRADADRLHARTAEMAALTFQRVADGRQRAVAAALLVQQCRARVRSAMWLSRSG